MVKLVFSKGKLLGDFVELENSTDGRAWLCSLPYEVEKPFTDSERGCEYYKPREIVYARTRGLARASYWAHLKYECGYDEVEFTDVRVRVYKRA